jgi:predicted nucleic-acid-binding protein
MLAVDTHVLVRFLTGDDPEQAGRAFALLRDKAVWAAKTVLLENGWVPRSLYGFEGERSAPALQALVGLEKVHEEDARAVRRALDWFSAGLDFADALHLASLAQAQACVSFDAGFRRRAARLTGVPVRAL